MIRIVAIATMALFLCLFFYLPSVYGPDRFLDQIHVEHALNERFCGEAHALRVLDRAITLHGDVEARSPRPAAASAAPLSSRVDAVAAYRLAEATAQLFNNHYTRSIDALLTLFLFRVAGLIDWLPFLMAFVVACVLDGYLRRSVKSSEFEEHSAEHVGVYWALGTLVVCGSLVLSLLPVTFHPFFLIVPPILVGVFGNQAIANYHGRG